MTKMLFLTTAQFSAFGLGEPANTVQVRRTIKSMAPDHGLHLVGSFEGKKEDISVFTEKRHRLFLTKYWKIRFLGIFLYTIISLLKVRFSKTKYDAVYSRNIGMLFLFSLIFPKTPKFIELHMPLRKIELFLAKFLVKNFQLKHIFCVSNILLIKTQKTMKNYPVRLGVLRNTASEKFEKIKRQTEEIGKEILYFGLFTERKGARLIIKLAEEMSDFHFTCYSRLPRSWKFELPPNLSILEPIAADKVPKVVEKSTAILIAPYSGAVGNEVADNQWGSPIKIFEYMASGCPFIASKIAIVEEIVGSDFPYLADPNDYQQWVRLIREIHGEPSDRFGEDGTRAQYLASFGSKVRSGKMKGVISRYV